MPGGDQKIGIQIDVEFLGKEAAAGLATLVKSAERSAKAFSKTGKQSKGLDKALKQINQNVRVTGSALKKVAQSSAEYAAEANKAAQASAKLDQGTEEFSSSLREMSDRTERASDEVKKLTQRKRQLNDATRKVDKTSKDYGKNLVKITKDEVVRGQSLRRFIVIYLQTALSIEAIKAVTIGLAREFGELVKEAREVDRSLKSIGAAADASAEDLETMSDLFSEIALVGDQTRGDLAKLADEFIRAGLSTRQTARALVVLNNASEATGRSMDDLKGGLLAAFQGDVLKGSKELLVNLQGMTKEQLEQDGILDALEEKYGNAVDRTSLLGDNWTAAKGLISDSLSLLIKQVGSSEELQTLVSALVTDFAVFLSQAVRSGRALEFVKNIMGVIRGAIEGILFAWGALNTALEVTFATLILIPEIFTRGFTKAIDRFEERINNSPGIKLLQGVFGRLGDAASGTAASSSSNKLVDEIDKLRTTLSADINNLNNDTNDALDKDAAFQEQQEKIRKQVVDLMYEASQQQDEISKEFEVLMAQQGEKTEILFDELGNRYEEVAASLDLDIPDNVALKVKDQDKLIQILNRAQDDLNKKVLPELKTIENLQVEAGKDFAESSALEANRLRDINALLDRLLDNGQKILEEGVTRNDIAENAAQIDREFIKNQIRQINHDTELARIELEDRKRQNEILTRNYEGSIETFVNQAQKNLQDEVNRLLEEEERQRKLQEEEARLRAEEAKRRREEAKRAREEFNEKMRQIIGAIVNGVAAFISSVAAGAEGTQDPQAAAEEITKAYRESQQELIQGIKDADQDVAKAQLLRDEDALKETLERFDEVKEILERQGIDEDAAEQLVILGEMKDLLREGRDFGRQNTVSFEEMHDELTKATDLFEEVTDTNFGPVIEDALIEQAAEAERRAEQFLASFENEFRSLAKQIDEAEREGDELAVFDLQKRQQKLQENANEVLSDLGSVTQDIENALFAVANRDPESEGVSDVSVDLIREFQELHKTLGEQAERGDPEKIAEAQKEYAEALEEKTKADREYVKEVEESNKRIVEENLKLGRESAKALIKDASTTIASAIPYVGEFVAPLVGPFIDLFDQAPEKVSEFLDNLIEGAEQFLKKLIDNAPIIINTLAMKAPDFVASLIDSIGKLINLLIPAGLKLLVALIQGVIRALPTIIRAITDLMPTIARTFMDFLIYDIPVLIEEFVKQVPDIAYELIRSIGVIIETNLKDSFIGRLVGGLFGLEDIGIGRGREDRSVSGGVKPGEPVIEDFILDPIDEKELLKSLGGIADEDLPKFGVSPFEALTSPGKEFTRTQTGTVDPDPLNRLTNALERQQDSNERFAKELSLRDDGDDERFKILLALLKAQEEANDLLREQNRNFATASGAFNPYADPTTANIAPSIPREVIINIGQERLANILLDLDESGYTRAAI